jgi:Spy/CpxP family protein refolding chaperone
LSSVAHGYGRGHARRLSKRSRRGRRTTEETQGATATRGVSLPRQQDPLTEEQQQAIDALVKKYLQPVKELDSAIAGVYTKDQHDTFKTAREHARALGKRGREADEIVNQSVALSAEQKARLVDLEAARRKLHDEIRAKMAALLTAEQREQLGGPFKERKRPQKDQSKAGAKSRSQGTDTVKEGDTPDKKPKR